MWETQQALEWAVAQFGDTATAERYALHDAYYHGNQRLEFAGPKWRQAFGNRFRPLAYNRCSAVVDAHADRLFVERFSAEGDPAAEALADAIWTANRMERRQDEVYTEAFALGDGYVIVWPDPETQRPTIWPQRASTIRVLRSEDTPGRVLAAAKCWTADSGSVRLNAYHPDRIERWVAPAKRTGTPLKAGAFVPFTGDDAGPVIPNPWGRVPVFAFANNARTGESGTSELRDIVPLQDALNKALADMMVAQESAAFPQKVVIGVNAAADPFGNPEGAETAEGLGRFALGMDRILALADPAAKIAEFSSVALSQFSEVAEGWDLRISRQSRVPVHYLSMTGDFPSGRALRVAEAPFVSKLEDRQRAFGDVWSAVMRFALRIAGTEAASLDAVWRSAAPMAEEDSWDIVLQAVSAGVPLEVALKLELGWDPDKLALLTAALDERRRREGAAMVVRGGAG